MYKNNFYSAALCIGMLTIFQQHMVASTLVAGSPAASSSAQVIDYQQVDDVAAIDDGSGDGAQGYETSDESMVDDSTVVDDGSAGSTVDNIDAIVAPVQMTKAPVVPNVQPVVSIVKPAVVVPIAAPVVTIAPVPAISVAPPPANVAVVAGVPEVQQVAEPVVRASIKSAATSFEVALKQVQEKTFEGLKASEETPDEKAARLKRFQNHIRKAMASKMAKAKTAAKHVFTKNAAGEKVAVVKTPVRRNDGRKAIVRKKHAAKNKKHSGTRKNPVVKNK